VVDVAIQGLAHSKDKFRHAANLLPELFKNSLSRGMKPIVDIRLDQSQWPSALQLLGAGIAKAFADKAARIPFMNIDKMAHPCLRKAATGPPISVRL
jgi:hypothetical protein